MLRHEPPPCERTFEIWHNLALEGVYRFGEPDPMRLVFTGSLLLPSTDPTGASYLFRLLSNLDDRGVRRCAAGRALAHRYQDAGLRPVTWGDLIVVGCVTWAATPVWDRQDHPIRTGQAVSVTTKGSTREPRHRRVHHP